MPRLFIALDPPVEIKRQLLELPRAYSGASWQTAAQIHLTLVFIGEVDKSQIPLLIETLKKIIGVPLTLTLKGVDYFGSSRSPRVLFAGVENSPDLLKLHKQVYHAVEDTGIVLERKKYIPHITLARLNRTPYACVADFLQTEALFKSDSFTLTQFHLFSSKQTRTGSHYQIEASFPLVSVADCSVD
jgi:RNA 2',3'-cyclic 3'-phosphodiesterase